MSTRCRACAAEVPEGALRCPTCQAPVGPLAPCPHCRGEGGISPHGEFRWVCDICGGPRVPQHDREVAWSKREEPLLRKADAARKARAIARGIAIASGALLGAGVVFFALLMIIFGFGLGLALASLVMLAPPLLGLVLASRRAGEKGREIGPALDAAWLAAANDVAASKQSASAEVIGKTLGLDAEKAEELVALLDVDRSIGGGRLRFPEVPAQPLVAPGHTLVATAEEEAAIAEQAAIEAQKKTFGA